MTNLSKPAGRKIEHGKYALDHSISSGLEQTRVQMEGGFLRVICTTKSRDGDPAGLRRLLAAAPAGCGRCPTRLRNISIR